MKRIWHPYHRWEDYLAGVWRKLPSGEEPAMLAKAIEFTGNHELYGSYMRMVAEEWPVSCEHNLTETSMNRGAWIGHAAAYMAIGTPEYITRRAWWMLTQEQRDLADKEAEDAIREWEIRHSDAGIDKQLQFGFMTVKEF